MKYIFLFFLFSSIFLTISFLQFNFFTNALAHFLNVNEPISDGEVLIVEGWIHKKLLVNVKEEFNEGFYKYILVSGMVDNPEAGTTRIKSVQSYNDASYVANELTNLGIDSSKIKVVTCPTTRIHKTFSMAQSARNWFRANDPTVKRANLITAWSHGRKSWCAYQRIFGNNFYIGILTYPKNQKPIGQWWLSRGGFRYQIYSLIGFIYSALWPIPF